MKVRLKFYGPLIIANTLSLVYLLFFFTYNWYISHSQTLDEALNILVSHNPRWITWGVCASGLGLFAGCILAIGLLVRVPDSEDFPDLTDKSLGIFPSFRGIGLFVAFVIIAMLIVSQGSWHLGLKNGFEIIGIFVWVLFLVTGLTLLPTLLVDVFYKKLPLLIFKALFKKENED